MELSEKKKAHAKGRELEKWRLAMPTAERAAASIAPEEGSTAPPEGDRDEGIALYPSGMLSMIEKIFSPSKHVVFPNRYDMHNARVPWGRIFMTAYQIT